MPTEQEERWRRNRRFWVCCLDHKPKYQQAVAEAEAGQPFPMDDARVLAHWLRQPRVIGRVLLAKRQHELVPPAEKAEPYGWILYRLDERRIVLLHLRVFPAYRRGGFGGELLGTLVRRVRDCEPPSRRRYISCDVPEEALDVQLFLKGQGFRADKVITHNGLTSYRMKLQAERPSLCRGK